MKPSELKKFQKECLEIHNRLRKEHGAPPLEYSEDLEKGAKKWAKELAKAGSLNHDESVKNAAENILSVSGSEPTPKLICDYWANEEQHYDYEKGDYQEKAAHFTQMVWVNTTHFGIDYEAGKDGIIYVVARYYPIGNYKGMFDRNVYKSGSAIAKRTRNPSVPLSKIPDTKFIEKYFTKIHKTIRDKHDSPPTKWDQKLSDAAEKAAKAIIEAREKGEEDPDLEPGYGRNVNFAVGGIPPLEDIAYSWYESAKDYNYDLNEHQQKSACFSQMVWHDSTSFGIGMAEKDKKCCCVCYYNPPGNVKGGYTRNVSKPKDSYVIHFEEA